jgi:hypothetical protein
LNLMWSVGSTGLESLPRREGSLRTVDVNRIGDLFNSNS